MGETIKKKKKLTEKYQICPYPQLYFPSFPRSTLQSSPLYFQDSELRTLLFDRQRFKPHTQREREREFIGDTMRKRGEAIESPANLSEEIQNGEPQSSQTQKASQYELSREQRIKENLERMQKLGILDLSLKLKSVIPSNTKRNPRNHNHNCSTTPRPSPAPPSGPTRRSSRLFYHSLSSCLRTYLYFV